MVLHEFISQTTTTAIDIGTLAILISIMVGIVTVWSAIRAARNEAKKASSILEEIRANTIDKLSGDIMEIKRKLEILEVRYGDRIRLIERSLSRLEAFNWRMKEKEFGDGDEDK